jgi:hypothetical protein
MKALWTVVKVVLGLALVIPVCMIILATALGIFGALVGLAFAALRLAVLGLIVYGVFRVAVALFGGRRQHPAPMESRLLPPVDPHYEAALRELDRELPEAR